jgi:hypothetical protein
MLTAVVQELANDVAPDLFNEVATEVCNIVRSNVTQTGYGGETTTDADLVTDVPCVYEATPNSAKYQMGSEYLSGRIMLPKVWNNDVIELAMTDKIVIQADDLINHDRTFQVKDVNPNHGVFYDVGVIEEI